MSSLSGLVRLGWGVEEDSNLDHLFEMALTAKPYLRLSLDRMRASISTLDSLPARRAFSEYLRKIIVADHSDAVKLIDQKFPEDR